MHTKYRFIVTNGEDFQDWMKLAQEDTVVKPTSTKQIYMEIQLNINPKESLRFYLITREVLNASTESYCHNDKSYQYITNLELNILQHLLMILRSLLLEKIMKALIEN